MKNYMENVVVIDHPLVQHKLTLMRDKNTGTKDFRMLLNELSTLMAYEVTRDLPMEEVDIETPVASMRARVLAGRKPAAKVGHIGLYRDPETLKPVSYYCKLPGDTSERDMIVVDPMLATGGSAAEGIRIVKEAGCKTVRLMCLVAAPEGIAMLHELHPDVVIYTAAVDSHLNDHGYIVPGLGDAGDRIFGTK